MINFKLVIVQLLLRYEVNFMNYRILASLTIHFIKINEDKPAEPQWNLEFI